MAERADKISTCWLMAYWSVNGDWGRVRVGMGIRERY